MNEKLKDDFFRLIEAERYRQDQKRLELGKSDTENDLFEWNVILSEEMGEIAKAINEGNIESLIKELVDLSAVATAMYEQIALNPISFDVSDFINSLIMIG